jgi:hypothetical protein
MDYKKHGGKTFEKCSILKFFLPPAPSSGAMGQA